MMGSTSTLFRYIGRQFLFNFAAIMTVLLGIMFMFDVVETLRRAGGEVHIPLATILSISLMKLPYLAQSILSIGVLFASIYTCWRLNKTSELVVIRSFGLSAWQFLSPMLLGAAAIGILATTVLNPLSAVFLARSNDLNTSYFQPNRDLVTVSKTGIWLRQPIKPQTAPALQAGQTGGEGYALIHSATFDRSDRQLNNVLVLFFDNADAFLGRMDSSKAYLRHGYWEIYNPVINDKEGARRVATQDIPTTLTSRKIEESFADPETISFWNIPEYLSVMKDAGFPATHLYIHFQMLLAQPFLLAAMILLAATFSLRPPRMGGVATMILLGVATGFLVFFVQSMLQAFGVSQKIPPGLAAWTPALVSLLLGATALLHLEDG
ncbi:MAG: LPS export ABC transporter permease LptG [Alphaproteobacteria bacterium]|nr:LPS export ABC transporter permease LptG [Alphaproteobacteria bacterium]MDE2336052.1 LPS export ABC transporter permease LptG [Alphaproteobacteria bacterium]